MSVFNLSEKHIEEMVNGIRYHINQPGYEQPHLKKKLTDLCGSLNPYDNFAVLLKNANIDTYNDRYNKKVEHVTSMKVLELFPCSRLQTAKYIDCYFAHTYECTTNEGKKAYDLLKEVHYSMLWRIAHDLEQYERMEWTI